MEKAAAKLELITSFLQISHLSNVQQLSALEGLYREWNERINVISRKDIDGLYEKHVLHSLSIAAVFAFLPGMM